jgi:squalene-hopene/tetraprenyl-beta-curcumene cyclase
VMRKALSFLHGLQRADGYVSRYKLPVWDTAIATLALTTANVDAAAEPLRRAGEYLISCQAPDGGVPFQRENVRYPDTDDTAFAVLALNRIDMGARAPAKARTMARALRWLLFMQGSDGGWAAFAKNQSTAVRGLLPVFKDDPPTADVVGHVLSALALVSEPRDVGIAADRMARGLSWLESMQLDNGSWFGRWGLTFSYGTAAVLSGLRDIAHLGANARMAANVVEESVEYLLRTQQEDGGWGEAYPTYYDFTAPNTAASTVEQTAWTVLGLLAVRQTARVSQAVERGIDYLLGHYDPNRGWSEAGYTVGAIWVYRNSLYPLLWGVWAIAEYIKAKSPAAGAQQSGAPKSGSGGAGKSSGSRSGQPAAGAGGGR